MKKEELAEKINYVWPDCVCGKGKQNYGWWGNIKFRWKLSGEILAGADLHELRNNIRINQIRQQCNDEKR